MQQRGQQRPVGPAELDPLVTELPLEDAELVAKGEDLCVLVAVTDWKQSKDAEHVRHHQVRQSHQHNRSSCRPDETAQHAGQSPDVEKTVQLCTGPQLGG